MVIGGNYRIRAMSFCLWSKGEDDHATDEATDRWDQQQKPGKEWVYRHGKPRQRCLTARARFRVVPSDDAECIMFRNTGSNVENDGTQSCYDADQCSQSQKSDLRPKAIVAQFHDLGNPAKNSVHGHTTRPAKSHGVRSFSFCVSRILRCGQRLPLYAQWLFSRSTSVGQAQEREDRENGYLGKELEVPLDCEFSPMGNAPEGQRYIATTMLPV